MPDLRPPVRVLAAADGDRRSALLTSVLGGLLILIAGLLAGFGWLDLLRDLGALGFGPRLPDALPLRRLAGASAQPLARVVLAFATVGLVAGLALARLPRPGRFALLLASSLALLALASEAAYGVQETQSLAKTISSRHPGSGVLVEAVLLALAGVLPAPRRPGLG